MKKVFTCLLLVVGSFCFGSEKNARITLSDLGYSTASKGYAAVGYGLEVLPKHLLSAYIGYWEGFSEHYAGLSYKYFISGDTSSENSWFAGASIQSGYEYDGEDQSASQTRFFGGHQWVLSDKIAIELDGGVSHNPDETFISLGGGFSFLF